MPQSHIVRYTTRRAIRPLITISEATFVIGHVSLLASAIVVVSPSLSSPSISNVVKPDVPTNDNLHLQKVISHIDDRVLVYVDGLNCHIVAEGREAENRLSKIEQLEENGKIGLYILAPKSEVHPLKTIGETHTIKDLERVSKWLEDYWDFKKAISKEIEHSTQGLEGLSDILSFLEIAANVIEVVGATGGVSLWLIRKLLKPRQTDANPFIHTYIKQAEKIIDFFEKIPKSRITEVSEGTGIPKENLLHMFKSLSFEHEPACFWHLPTIQDELLQPALARAATKRKFRSIKIFTIKIFFIILLIGGMVIALESGLSVTISTYLMLVTFILVLFIIAK